LFDEVDKFQNDAHWRDYLMFYEYFHGDNGRGVGANHQTGWSGFVAILIQLFAAEGGRSYTKRKEKEMKTKVIIQTADDSVAKATRNE
jgi:hypothetical protein